MSLKCLSFSFLLVSLLASPALAEGPKSPLDVTLLDKHDGPTISLSYPQFGWPEIDRTIKSWTEEVFKNINANYFDDLMSREAMEPESFKSLYFGNSWEISASPGAVSLLYNIYEDTGGAHGNAYSKTLTMNLQGRSLEYFEIFGNTEGLWEALSQICTKDLLGQEDFKNDKSLLFSEGLEPVANRFASFMVDPKGLRIIFDQYQVAAYSFGRRECLAPLAALAQFKPNPEIWPSVNPKSPSFDCGQASTPREVTICQNPILSRYDAELAEIYKKVLAAKGSDSASLVAEQGGWLKESSKSCFKEDVEPQSCLLKEYRTRLDHLKTL